MSNTEKSIYSLVLSDNVIEAVDRMARNNGLSRSAMVNQLLAEKTCCETPEMHIRSIANAIMEEVGSEFYVAEQPSPATIACKTALKYRYKPTLRYAVELFSAAKKRTGELKVTVRSQSGQLCEDLSGFFRVWVKLEQKYIAGALAHDIHFRIEPGKFVRTLNLPPREVSDARLGKAVADYMAMLDDAMKCYFAYLPDTERGELAAEQSYAAAIERQQFIL